MKTGDRTLELVEVVRFVIVTLTRWAQVRQYGELRIVVRDGQISMISESVTYQGSVPKRPTNEARNIVSQLQAD